MAIICHSSPHLFTSQSLSGWMGQMHIFRFLQKYLIWFKLRLLLGHSRTFTELSIIDSCCVHRVIVLLEGEPSAQSEVLNALDWVFIKALSIFWCIELFFYSDVSLSPCRWKTAPQHEAATSTLGTLHVMSRAGFLQTWCLEMSSSNQRISFLTVWGSFRCFFAHSKCVFMCLHWREDWVLPHCHKAQIGGVLQWCVSVCRFSHLHIWSWSSSRVTIRFLFTTLTKALLHHLVSLARRPALGRVLVVSNFFH